MLDIDYESVLFESPKYGKIIFSIKGTSINEFLTPEHEESEDHEDEEEDHVNMVNRVGKFNYDAHTHSLPKKRVNAFMNWSFKNYDFNLNIYSLFFPIQFPFGEDTLHPCEINHRVGMLSKSSFGFGHLLMVILNIHHHTIL